MWPIFAVLLLGLVDDIIADDRLDTLITTCERYEYGQPERAIEAADEVLRQSSLEKDPSIWLHALGCKAWALMARGELLEAIELTEQLARERHRVDDAESEVKLLRREASLRHRQGEQQHVIELLDQGLILAEQEDLRVETIKLLIALGINHGEGGDYDLAIEYYQRALALIQPGDDPATELPIIYNLGVTYQNAGRFMQARAELEKLLKPLAEPGMQVRLASLHAVLGSIERELGNPDNAEKHFSISARMHESLDNAAEHAALLIDRAQLSLELGDLEAAASYAESALAEARRSGFYFTINGAMEILVDVYREQGHSAQALALLQERYDSTYEHFRERERSRLAEVEARLGVQRREYELIELRREREINALALQRQNMITMAVVVLVLLGALGLFWQRRSNRRLTELSRTDMLTGLPNRRCLTERLDQAGQREGDGETLLLLVDLDQFKSVNDSHGHDVGDRVLKAVAEAMQRFAELHHAELGRWGGEEFILLLPASDADHARRLGLELLATVARLSVSNNLGEAIEITASIGFSPLGHAKQHSGQEPWEPAMIVADQLLYRAKQQGRNRAVGLWPERTNPTLNHNNLDNMLKQGDYQLIELILETSNT